MTASTPTDMTPEKYTAMRSRLDTRRAVARALGVHHETMLKRERGAVSISREAGLALRFLARHGLPAYLRARPTKEPPPERVEHGTPGELREALRILGWNGKMAARMILGPGEGKRVMMSRYLTGADSVPEHVARLVKVRLGLRLDEPWPKRAEMTWAAADARVEL